MSRRYEDEQTGLRAKIAPLKKEITKHNRHDCTTDMTALQMNFWRWFASTYI